MCRWPWNLYCFRLRRCTRNLSCPRSTITLPVAASYLLFLFVCQERSLRPLSANMAAGLISCLQRRDILQLAGLVFFFFFFFLLIKKIKKKFLLTGRENKMVKNSTGFFISYDWNAVHFAVLKLVLNKV